MQFSYTLDQTDYLINQLFLASLNEEVKKQRIRRRIIWSIGLLSLAYIFYVDKNNFLFYYFLVCAILYAVFYPYYSRWLYRRHYQRQVINNYKNRFDKITNTIVEEEQIQVFDETSEAKISISQVEKIFEISDYFFVHIQSGTTLIIPKLKIDNPEPVKDELKAIANKKGIEFVEIPDWKWK
jgi:hypothetical protein